jgi:hypothetical protein
VPIFKEESKIAGVVYVDLFEPRETDPFFLALKTTELLSVHVCKLESWFASFFTCSVVESAYDWRINAPPPPLLNVATVLPAGCIKTDVLPTVEIPREVELVPPMDVAVAVAIRLRAVALVESMSCNCWKPAPLALITTFALVLDSVPEGIAPMPMRRFVDFGWENMDLIFSKYRLTDLHDSFLILFVQREHYIAHFILQIFLKNISSKTLVSQKKAL